MGIIDIITSFGELLTVFNGESHGYYQQGRDKLNRPYEKRLDSNGNFSKREMLKDGSMKYTFKIPPKDKK